MKTVSLKDYAEQKRVSYEAVRQQVIRYKKELGNHIIRDGRQQFLDEEAVAFHEAIFTQHFSNCGFKWKAYCNPEENVIANPYPLFMAPIQMVMDYHCPFFKRKLFFYPMKEKNKWK